MTYTDLVAEMQKRAEAVEVLNLSHTPSFNFDPLVCIAQTLSSGGYTVDNTIDPTTQTDLGASIWDSPLCVKSTSGKYTIRQLVFTVVFQVAANTCDAPVIMRLSRGGVAFGEEINVLVGETGEIRRHTNVKIDDADMTPELWAALVDTDDAVSLYGFKLSAYAGAGELEVTNMEVTAYLGSTAQNEYDASGGVTYAHEGWLQAWVKALGPEALSDTVWLGAFHEGYDTYALKRATGTDEAIFNPVFTIVSPSVIQFRFGCNNGRPGTVSAFLITRQDFEEV